MYEYSAYWNFQTVVIINKAHKYMSMKVYEVVKYMWLGLYKYLNVVKRFALGLHLSNEC